jgi:hypothetical protein
MGVWTKDLKVWETAYYRRKTNNIYNSTILELSEEYKLHLRTVLLSHKCNQRWKDLYNENHRALEINLVRDGKA